MEASDCDPSALTFREKKTLFDHGTPLIGRLNSSAHSSPTALGPYFDKHCSKLIPNVVRAKQSLAPVRLFGNDTTTDDGAAMRQLSALRQQYSSQGMPKVATQMGSASPGLSKRTPPSRSPDIVAQLWLPDTFKAAASCKSRTARDFPWTNSVAEGACADPLHAVLELLRAYVDENQHTGVPVDPRLVQALLTAQAGMQPPAPSQNPDSSSPSGTSPGSAASPQPALSPQRADSSDSDRADTTACTLSAQLSSVQEYAPASMRPDSAAAAAQAGVVDELRTPFRTSDSAWAATRVDGGVDDCAQLHQEAQALRERLRQRALAQYENNRLAVSAMERSLARLQQAAHGAVSTEPDPETATVMAVPGAPRPGPHPAATSPATIAAPAAFAADMGSAGGAAADLAAMSRQRDQLAARCAQLQRQCNGLLSYISMLGGNSAAAGLHGRRTGPGVTSPCSGVAGVGTAGAVRTQAQGGPAGERVVVRMVVLPDTQQATAHSEHAPLASVRPGSAATEGCGIFRDRRLEELEEVQVEEGEASEEEEEEGGTSWLGSIEEQRNSAPVRVRLHLRVVRTDPGVRPRMVLPLCVGLTGVSPSAQSRDEEHKPPHQQQAHCQEPHPLVHPQRRERLVGICEEDGMAAGSDGVADTAEFQSLGSLNDCASTDRRRAGARSGGGSSASQPSARPSAFTGGGDSGVNMLAEWRGNDTGECAGLGELEVLQQRPDRQSLLDPDLRRWSAPAPGAGLATCSIRDSCRDDAYLCFTARGIQSSCQYPLASADALAAAVAAADAADRDAAFCAAGAASGRTSDAQRAVRVLTPPCSPRTSPCSPTGSHDPASSLMGSCSGAAAGGSAVGAGCLEEGYLSEEYDLADSEWDELAAAAAANGPGALLSAVAFLREQLQLAHLEIVSLTMQLGNLSHQREGLRARACQHDAALQLLAINEGEALLEANRLRAQLASERAARARLSAQCEDLQNRLLHGIPDRPHLSMHHSSHSHAHHPQHGHPAGLVQHQSLGQVLALGSPGRRGLAMGAGLLSSPAGLGLSAAPTNATDSTVLRKTRARSGGGSLFLPLHHLPSYAPGGTSAGASGVQQQHRAGYGMPPHYRAVPLLPPTWSSQQHQHLQAHHGMQLTRHRSAPRHRATGASSLAHSADWKAAIAALEEGLKRTAGGPSGQETLKQVTR